MAKNRRSNSASAAVTRRNRRNRRDRRRNTRRNRRRTMSGGEMNPAPLNYSLADSWSSKASLNQGGDYFKYHREQHGGADALMGAPYPAQVVSSTLPSEMYASAHLSGNIKALNEISGLSDREGTPAIVPSQSGGPANTTGGGRNRNRRRTVRRRDRRDRRNRRNRRTMYGGTDPLGYASVKAPTMLLPNAAAYSAAALNPEYVSMKGYAEGIAAAARDKISY